MDTPRTGSDLIEIKAGDLLFKIVGRKNYPNSPVSAEGQSQVHIRKAPAGAEVYVSGSTQDSDTKFACAPLFYEQRDYEVYIEYNKNDDVRFVHDNPNVSRKVQPRGGNYPVLGGIINFSNDIGFSTLSLEVNGKVAISVEIEVFPLKIDYQKDYRAMLQDITEEVYNLAFGMIQKTYQTLSITDKDVDKQSPVEYIALFEYIYEKLQNAMTVIESYPHNKLEKHTELVQENKVRKCDKDTVKWMCKHPNHAYRAENGRIRFEKAQVTKKHVTVDTFENQLVKHILESMQRKLGLIRSMYLKNTEGMYEKNVSEELMRRLDAWTGYLNQKTTFSFLRNVSTLSQTKSMSLVFAMAPGYRELYRCHLMLQKGLTLFGDLCRLSLKDVALLYEYWCYIKLNRLIADKGYKTRKGHPISVDRGGLFVTMKKGTESIVRYENPDTGDKITLAYNREYTRSKNGPILTQKPDNVFSLVKDTDGAKYEYVFDAKYRIDMAYEGSDYKKKYGTAGPLEQDINTMHRYRDAIVHKNKKGDFYERDMYGAYVLFPYDDGETFKDHDFYKSIEEVNIGALPFLPGETDLVDNFLSILISDDKDGASRKVILPAGVAIVNQMDFLDAETGLLYENFVTVQND